MLEFAFERAVKDRGQQCVAFGGGFGLEMFESVHFGLQCVKFGDDAVLSSEGWDPISK